MSEGLTQLSYDIASFYNLKPEEAFEKLKSGISGESEPLKELGILVNDTTTKTYAYTHGIAKQGEQLTEAQKVQARYGSILQATKNAQGDLARTIDSPTNKLRIMKEQAQQIGIQFGQFLIPILERLIAVIKPLMDKFWVRLKHLPSRLAQFYPYRVKPIPQTSAHPGPARSHLAASGFHTNG